MPQTSADTAGPPVRTPRRYGPNHRWVVLSVGVAAQASFSAMFSGIPVTGITMRADYHLSTGELGLVLGCLGLGVAVSDIVWGLLTDRFGDRRILLTGLTATGALLVAMAVAVTPGDRAGMPLLAACMLAAGALGGSVNASSGRAIMTWFTDGQRGFAMSVRQTAIPAGGAVGVALLPGLAAAYGFRVVYAVPAAFCLLAAAAAWRWLHEPDRVPAPAADRPEADRSEAARSPLLRWDVWRLALASGLLTVPQIAVLSFTAIFLHDAKGADVALASLTVLIAQLGGGAARIWTGRRSDRRGDRRAHIRGIGALTALVMAGAAVLTHAPTPLTVAALALGGLLANAWHGVAYTEIAAMSGPSRAGTALGLEGTTIFTAAFLTPLLIPAVLTFASWETVWALAAVAPLLAVPLTPGGPRSRLR
ncbi:sugar phosphate permease [Streptosporangium becharense]|uniref:Sugar phosphate permease n=1 Tax=Streptosporangium becharense TaxID=1816182 RepID=A0A7W9IM33_9ACTN|nr:MFS transporter [Streptosporangium becharense]MBB2910505.1 sugar phosphate permease [Streptosporangium becharense]MBB5823248.1 sugar phosphate permease [Streptosporangium becharense]